MMKTFARVDSGEVVEVLNTDGDIFKMFCASLEWVDVTDALPQPGQGWGANFAAGVWSFVAPPAPVAPSIAQVKAVLCESIDATADAAYIAIGGPSPGRLAEYQQANTDATAYKAAGYAGAVPPTVQCWATASGITAQAAADSILATAAQWMAVLNGVRSARLLGKGAVNAAATVADAEAAAATAIANVTTAAGGA